MKHISNTKITFSNRPRLVPQLDMHKYLFIYFYSKLDLQEKLGNGSIQHFALVKENIKFYRDNLNNYLYAFLINIICLMLWKLNMIKEINTILRLQKHFFYSNNCYHSKEFVIELVAIHIQGTIKSGTANKKNLKFLSKRISN